MILDLLQRMPVTLLLLAMLGAVVVEAISILALVPRALRRGEPALSQPNTQWIVDRLRLASDIGRLAVSVGFFGTVLGLIGATRGFRDGAPEVLLGNLDLVLETTALGLATFLTAQLTLLTLSPKNIAAMQRWVRGNQPQQQHSDSIAPSGQ